MIVRKGPAVRRVAPHPRIWAALAASLLWAANPALAQDAPHERQARGIFERLISFRSAAGHGQVPAMAQYIVETLRQGGVPEADIARIPHGETAALLVRVPGRDPSARPLLFSGHMDVVDARPEDWERDPFRLVEEDGFFFGRGTGDNKTGITAMISTILRMRGDGFQPRRTLVFAFVGDEETTMDTTRLIAAHDWVRTAEYAINSDAGGGGMTEEGQAVAYGVQGAEKAYASFRLTIRNPGGHSSRPRTDHAIYELAEALLKVRGIRHPVRLNAITRTTLRIDAQSLPPEPAAMLNRFLADPDDREAIDALSANPEFLVQTSTTCVATMAEAGHAENALPQRAQATINCRIFPGETIDEVRERLLAAIGNDQAVLETIGQPTVSPVSEPRPDVMAAITASIHRVHPGIPVTPYLEAGATDGLVYRAAGIPTFGSSGVFMRGSDMFFHGLNERIPVPAFYSAIGHIHELAVELGNQ